jgi:hypothetical protein
MFRTWPLLRKLGLFFGATVISGPKTAKIGFVLHNWVQRAGAMPPSRPGGLGRLPRATEDLRAGPGDRAGNWVCFSATPSFLGQKQGELGLFCITGYSGAGREGPPGWAKCGSLSGILSLVAMADPSDSPATAVVQAALYFVAYSTNAILRRQGKSRRDGVFPGALQTGYSISFVTISRICFSLCWSRSPRLWRLSL